MTLDEFIKQPRGDVLFDYYAHPTPVASPLGEFRVEMFVAANEPPTKRMVAAARQLVDTFHKHGHALTDLVYEDYLARCTDPTLRGRLLATGVAPDLPREAIVRYLDPKILEIADDCRMVVFIGPLWDPDLGLFLEWQGDRWARISS